MSSNFIAVPKYNDETLLKFLKKISDETNPSTCTAVILGGAEKIDCKLQKPEEIVEQITKLKSFAIHHASINYDGFNILFNRNLPGNLTSASFDHFEVRTNPQGFNKTSTSDLVLSTALIGKLFGVAKLSSQVSGYDSSTAQDWVAASQAALENMQEVALAISADLVTSRSNLDRQFTEKQSSLDAQYAERQAKLDDAHQTRLSALDVKAEELDALRKTLDDRNNTHVRREIRQSLKGQLKDRYASSTATAKTNSLRLPIHAVCLGGLIVIAAAAYWFGSELLIATSGNTGLSPASATFLIARQLGLTFGFLALLAYYIRWMNRWFDMNARSDFELRQFDLDVDRASWVVETGLEWRKSEGGIIPTVLLESITRNLFSGSVKDERDELHPADYLAQALLGNAKALKVSMPGAEIDLDAKKIRKDANRA